MQPTSTTVKNEVALSEWAQEFADELGKDGESATVVGLRGPLGAGKTTLVGKLLAAYGVAGPVTSPTYTIESVYELPAGPFARAYHLDAYRLESAQDLAALDFSERLADPENLVLVEWAGIVREALPENTIYINLSFLDEDAREITLSYE